MRARGEFALALVLDLVGAGAVLLVSTRTWQTITLHRAGLRPLVADVNGRGLDAAGTALAVAALAAVVAVVATRGVVRRVVGVVLALVGVGIVWRSLSDSGAVSAARARGIVSGRYRGAVLSDAVPHVEASAVWPWCAAAGGVLVALAGLAVAVRGTRWQAMSERYQPPAGGGSGTGPGAESGTGDAAGDLAIWKALDRGDDPTI